VRRDNVDFEVEAAKVIALMGVCPTDAAEGMLASLLITTHAWAMDSLARAANAPSLTVRDLLTIEAARFVGQHLAVADML